MTHILEVGGPSPIEQSPNAIKIDGVISIIGFLGSGADKQPSFLDALSHVCIVRGFRLAVGFNLSIWYVYLLFDMMKGKERRARLMMIC